MSSDQKKRVALDVITNNKSITNLADENNTSRKFIRQQGKNAQKAIDNVFNIDGSNDDNVLYNLPVTKKWIAQFVLALMLLGHASYRNISMTIKDLLDYDISEGTIHSIFKDAVGDARIINAVEDLSKIDVTANDELYHKNKPILSGIDIRSLYCYLLSAEDQRDEDTWAINLMDAKEKNLNPQRTIGDDGKGLVAGHKMVFPSTPFDYDNFHLSHGLMNLRRYFRNRLKSAITVLNKLEQKFEKPECNEKLVDKIIAADNKIDRLRHISSTLDILVRWLEHDILNKAGPTPEERRDLYDFVVDEFKKLEEVETHRIKPLRITLENKRDTVLNFSNVLNDKFKAISLEYKLSMDTVWDICKLQRCSGHSDQYFIRAMPLRVSLKNQFQDIENAVVDAMDKTERTSSMVENLNGRVRTHLRNRKEIGYGFLDLLRFFLNHKPIIRSARKTREGKTPAEILSGKPHLHWLELLGFQRFKRAA